MTDDEDRSTALPWDAELLAQLHAGALEPAHERALRAATASDERALGVLRALDATVADLALLRSAPVAVAVPADVAARLDAALAAAVTPTTTVSPTAAGAAPVAGTAPVGDLAAAREARTARRTGPGRGWLAAGTAVAAAAVAVVVLGGVTGGATTTTGTAVAQPLELGAGPLGTTVLASLGTTGLGPLSEPSVLAGCLTANGYPGDAPVLGSTPVRLDGAPGTLLLLTNGTAGSFTALVVGPACSAGVPDTLTEQQIGAR